MKQIITSVKQHVIYLQSVSFIYFLIESFLMISVKKGYPRYTTVFLKLWLHDGIDSQLSTQLAGACCQVKSGNKIC